ncbi:selenocysteine lyase/cysteine desulfurase [Rhodovulum iodosum]|uniref:Selenocysteine lyase/cysteine desulfurase n=1 Tax=Rhodovulum iodosum TaxID=68291 RepID=A0ABV3XTX5_9RHOB|nr:aminotransferase class V-fold PLP-dependent enzyme [Rhodovulum robiginosum]RSK32008.1 aminotransferase class V-fold PLP-dependent enzyme [Rhodovulum robiginosum]
MVALDINYVRNQFPAFRAPALREQAFFENAGGSYPCRYVIWRLNRFYTERKVQPFGPYDASARAGQEMDEARIRLSAHLGVAREELHFGPSTTANTFVLAQAFRRWLRPGEVVVVTNQDHEANSGPWRRLAEDGIEIREWRVDPETGHLDPKELERLLDGKVRLVCFPHCSNIVGEINDVPAISAKVRAAGAYSCVDGVSLVPHGYPDIGRLGADIYLFSAYKTFGPHQGLMTIRHELAVKLPAQGHGFNADDPTKRFTPAGPDHAQVAACAGMADYIDAIYGHHFQAGRDALGRTGKLRDLIRTREVGLLGRLVRYLADRPDLRVLGRLAADERRAPTIAIALEEPGAAAAARLAQHGVMAGGGDFYAPRLLQAMGVNPRRGVLRLSFLHYTTGAELDRLIDALDTEL